MSRSGGSSPARAAAVSAAAAPAAAVPTNAAAGARGHAAIPHTADAGFRAQAPTLPELFAEAGLALAELTADVAGGVVPDTWIEVDLSASDLPALAFGWLNALIAEMEIARAAVVAIEPPEVTAPSRPKDAWRLRGRAGLLPHGRPGVQVRRPPKSATFHGLTVEPVASGWTMVAYLDI